MYSLTQLKRATALFFIVLVDFAFLSVQAVVPPPDGGYPNFTTAEGQNALKNLTTGAGNTAVGWFSLFSATTASFNTGVGAGTLALNTGDNNTATGTAALFLNTTGPNNTAVGSTALLHNDTGANNTGVGADALSANTTGAANTATGRSALSSNTTGNLNTAIGYHALLNNTTAGGNTAIGSEALLHSTGFSNTAIGENALSSNISGAANTALGAGAGFNVSTADGVICIGVVGANVSNTCFIGSIRGVQTQNADAIPVVVDSAGQLGTASSSLRFKNEIKLMDKASESILGLKPVTFHYKSDKTVTPQFGLIAEEVAEVNPDLVVRDKNGEIYTVRYDAVNAMLLNEFLKEHRKVQEQEAAIARLNKTIDTVLARLDEQDSKIQGVSDQVKMTQAQQIVLSQP